MARKTVADRFLEKVDRSNPEGCWLWTAYRNRDGYGRFGFNGKSRAAHRLMYQWVRGDIPRGLVVRHSCDTPSCVNPDHLEVGTQRENIHDMMVRGRWGGPVGEGNHHAKLTEDDVREIRERAAQGASAVEVSQDYPVSPEQAANIISGRSWKRVGGPVTDLSTRGERSTLSKLTEDDVREILSSEGVSHSVLAQRYGVTQPTISRIIRRDTWKHVSLDVEVTYG